MQHRILHDTNCSDGNPRNITVNFYRSVSLHLFKGAYTDYGATEM